MEVEGEILMPMSYSFSDKEIGPVDIEMNIMIVSHFPRQSEIQIPKKNQKKLMKAQAKSDSLS